MRFYRSILNKNSNVSMKYNLYMIHASRSPHSRASTLPVSCSPYYLTTAPARQSISVHRRCFLMKDIMRDFCLKLISEQCETGVRTKELGDGVIVRNEVFP